jgi:hypothetical protein
VAGLLLVWHLLPALMPERWQLLLQLTQIAAAAESRCLHAKKQKVKIAAEVENQWLQAK